MLKKTASAGLFSALNIRNQRAAQAMVNRLFRERPRNSAGMSLVGIRSASISFISSILWSSCLCTSPELYYIGI